MTYLNHEEWHVANPNYPCEYCTTPNQPPNTTTFGHCKICGCPPDKMPMVNRGTGWCSENHRKQLANEQEQELPE